MAPQSNNILVNDKGFCVSCSTDEVSKVFIASSPCVISSMDAFHVLSIGDEPLLLMRLEMCFQQDFRRVERVPGADLRQR